MKWPETLTVVRHGESEYNVLKHIKEEDPLYIEFKKAYNRRKKDPERARKLALQIHEGEKYLLKKGDHKTELTDNGKQQAEITGRKLADLIELPEIIFVSPYERTHQTLGNMAIGWPELSTVPMIEDERLREQEHGLAILYNDWRIFQVLHPEQDDLRQYEGEYWYRYPQGENIPDTRERLRSWLGALTRDYAGQDVLTISHHLTILGLRANLERFGAQQYIDFDKNEKPVNCGVTIYRGNKDLGSDGKLILDKYNQQLY